MSSYNVEFNLPVFGILESLLDEGLLQLYRVTSFAGRTQNEAWNARHVVNHCPQFLNVLLPWKKTIKTSHLKLQRLRGKLSEANLIINGFGNFRHEMN